MTAGSSIGRIGILWRGDPEVPPSPPEINRFIRVVDTLEARGVSAEAIVYSDLVSDKVRGRLLGLNGVLVWVDPIVNGQDRSRLDAVLRDVASQGVCQCTPRHHFQDGDQGSPLPYASPRVGDRYTSV